MKGDKTIVKILNQLLAGELTAVDQYLLHGERYADLGFTHLAERALHESEEERGHARLLIQRILLLEGNPDLASRHPIKTGPSVPDMLKADLYVEYQVIGDLKKAVAACESAGDYVSRAMLVGQLKDSEMDHAWWLEKQLGLIDLVGLPNYLQSQMNPGLNP